MIERIRTYSAIDTPQDMAAAAKVLEQRFDIEFTVLLHFKQGLLHSLQSANGSPEDLPEGAFVASRSDPGVLELFGELTWIANSGTLTVEKRRRYLAALQAIYRRLPGSPLDWMSDPGALFVAPEREGRILAETLGWLPSGRSLRPHVKRIHYGDDLVVGLGDFVPSRRASRCILIDGAIASGATLISLIERLRAFTEYFSIYSVHATCEGLRCILAYGREAGVKISITVGHATPGINRHFYAVGSDGRVMVGDLGDTIAPLLDAMFEPAHSDRKDDTGLDLQVPFLS